MTSSFYARTACTTHHHLRHVSLSGRDTLLSNCRIFFYINISYFFHYTVRFVGLGFVQNFLYFLARTSLGLREFHDRPGVVTGAVLVAGLEVKRVWQSSARYALYYTSSATCLTKHDASSDSDSRAGNGRRATPRRLWRAGFRARCMHHSLSHTQLYAACKNHSALSCGACCS